MDGIETAQIVERLKSDTTSNVVMFEQNLPVMERDLANVMALFRALESGTITGEDSANVELAIAYIDVVPSYPLVFDAVDIHGDWLRMQTRIYEITKRIDERLSPP